MHWPRLLPGRAGRNQRVRSPAAGRCAAFVGAAAALWFLPHSAPAQLQRSAVALLDLTIEELGEVVVTSVSRRAERLAEAPASIYVITAEDIRRSGARTLPEALRLAPNLQVARADANQYAISARGFNNVLANKLLVMIDGRTVYSPLFSGVFWESQPVMLEDVERIEVIDGPGGTLWGTNAVNGVINVITRSAAGTQGALATVGAGNDNALAGARYGGRAAGGGHYRVYGRYLGQDETQRANGSGVVDASDTGLGGFRADWSDADRDVTVQGEVYGGEIDQRPDGRRIAGAHLLARWTQRLGVDNAVRVQAYYDRAERHHRLQFRDALDTADLDLQHGFRLGASHRITWGGGYRYARDNFEALWPTNGFIPEDRTLRWSNVYAQDEIALHRDVTLTVGVRGERNPYTGGELLPSALLGWRIDYTRFAWAGVARAVRAPSRVDRDFHVPRTAPFLLAGGPDFRSEVSTVYQAGYRARAGGLSYSVTAFHHEHERLRSLEPRPGGARFENRIGGSTAGVTAWAQWRAAPWWQLSVGGTRQWQRLAPDPDSNDIGGINQLGNDPRYWWVARSAWDVTSRHTLDVFVRRVGALPRPAVPAYTAVDLRLGWRVTPRLELSATVQNLFDPGHPEWGAAADRVEFGRIVFFQLSWRP